MGLSLEETLIRKSVYRSAIGLASIYGAALTCAPSYAETLIIGGTGMGLAAMEQVGESLAASEPDFTFQVLPSLGSSGGIKALSRGAIGIAIAGRALKPREQALDIEEAACLTTALVFATSHKGDKDLRTESLPALYADPQPQWTDGTPLKIILRSRAGSENPYLYRAVPDLEEPMTNAYDRPGIPVGATDQENTDLAIHTKGSLAVMSLLQLRGEKLQLQKLSLNGVPATPATLADKTYPMPLRVCLVAPRNPSPEAVRFIDYIKSEAGQALVKSFDAIPTN